MTSKPRKKAAKVTEDGPEKASPKTRLLKAATFEFAERGFAGARIDVIARRAQLNKQLIYHYFGGKQQLYAAVLSDMVRRLQANGADWLGTDLETDDSMEMHRRLVKTVRKGEIGRQWVRLLMFEALETGGMIHLEDARRHVYQGGVRALEVAQEQGRIDPAFDPKLLRMALFGLALIPSLLPQIVKLITGLDQNTPDFTERWIGLIDEIYLRLAPRERS